MAILRFVDDNEIDFNSMNVNRYAQEYRNQAKELRDNPGQVGVIKEGLPAKYASKLAAEIRSGELRAFGPAGSFDAKHKDGTVYARFVAEATQ